MRQLRGRITRAVMALGAVAWIACGDEAPEPVASVQVTPALDTVRAGATIQLTAVARDASGAVLTGRTVTWASGNQTVATVDATGLVTGAGGGEATITATSEGQSDLANVTVWVGVTGTWMGTIDSPSGMCQLDLAIGESAAAAITGNSLLHPPCLAAEFAVSGTNDIGGVPDSVFMHFDNGGLWFEFRGTFDGAGTLTGGVWDAGSGPYGTDLTRQTLERGPLAPARVDGRSTAGAFPLLRRWPDTE